MDISEIRKNTKLLINGIPYDVDEAEFMKPGKGHAIYRLKLRNLIDGSTLSRTYHSGDEVEKAYVATREMQYLYKEGENYIFMDTKTFEQHILTEKQLEREKYFLKEGTLVTALMMDDKLLNITLPTFVELVVMKSEVASKTETVAPQNKSAILETGYSINVPIFIKEGDIIKIDTRTGTYLERVGVKK